MYKGITWIQSRTRREIIITVRRSQKSTYPLYNARVQIGNLRSHKYTFFFFFTSRDICWVLSSFVAGGCEARPNNLRGGMSFPAENSKHRESPAQANDQFLPLDFCYFFFKSPGKGGSESTKLDLLQFFRTTWREEWSTGFQSKYQMTAFKERKQARHRLNFINSANYPAQFNLWLAYNDNSLTPYLCALQWEINSSGASVALSL